MRADAARLASREPLEAGKAAFERTHPRPERETDVCLLQRRELGSERGVQVDCRSDLRGRRVGGSPEPERGETVAKTGVDHELAALDPVLERRVVDDERRIEVRE